VWNGFGLRFQDVTVFYFQKEGKKKIKDVFFQKWNVVVMNGSGGNKVVF
jgi:hypothetical protein